MLSFTRRALLRSAGLTAASATLGLPAHLTAHANSTNVPAGSGSVFHVFGFQWKPDTTYAQKARAAKEIAAFQGAIPGLLQTHVGPNLSPRGKGYTFGGVMHFRDQPALDAYVQNPKHKALLAWLVPLIDAIELDLRA